MHLTFQILIVLEVSKNEFLSLYVDFSRVIAFVTLLYYFWTNPRIYTLTLQVSLDVKCTNKILKLNQTTVRKLAQLCYEIVDGLKSAEPNRFTLIRAFGCASCTFEF